MDQRLRRLADRAERLVEASAVLQRAFADRGIRLVVVGGSALTAWDSRLHVSLDIDFVGAGLTAELDEVFIEEFGLKKEGRHWYDEELRLAVERPGITLEPSGADVVELRSPGGLPVVVIALEDLVVDRVREWEATGAYESWVQAAGMLAHPALDRDRLDRRVQELDVTVPLAAIEWLAQEHAAGRRVGLPESHAAQSGLRDGLGGVIRAMAEYRAIPER